jgi:hypothetical protein
MTPFHRRRHPHEYAGTGEVKAQLAIAHANCGPVRALPGSAMDARARRASTSTLTRTSDAGAQLMIALGVQSEREIARTRIRVRTALATQTRDQGRYPGGAAVNAPEPGMRGLSEKPEETGANAMARPGGLEATSNSRLIASDNGTSG